MVGLLTLLSCFSAEWRIGKKQKNKRKMEDGFTLELTSEAIYVVEEIHDESLKKEKNNFAQPRGNQIAKSLREWNKTRAGGGESNFSFALVRPSWFQPRERRIAKEPGQRKRKESKTEKINDIGRCDWMERRRQNSPAHATHLRSFPDSLILLNQSFFLSSTEKRNKKGNSSSPYFSGSYSPEPKHIVCVCVCVRACWPASFALCHSKSHPISSGGRDGRPFGRQSPYNLHCYWGGPPHTFR